MINSFLTRQYSSILRCGSNVVFQGKLFRSSSSSTQLPEPHSWDSIYTRLDEQKKPIRKPFYVIGRMPTNGSMMPSEAYYKPFWRARLFHPDMVKTGLLSGGYTKAEADMFYQKKYVEGAIGVAKKYNNSVYTHPGTFQKIYPGNENEEAYYDFHFFPGKKYQPKVKNGYGRRRPKAQSGDPDFREKIPHSQVVAGELFFDFDMHTNTASMRHVQAFIFCSWPIPLKNVDIKITRSDGSSSNSWDHWASDILFDKRTERIDLTLLDVTNRKTRVPCFVLRKLPHKPPLLAIKDKITNFVKSVGMWTIVFAGLFGSFVALDLVFEIFKPVK